MVLLVSAVFQKANVPYLECLLKFYYASAKYENRGHYGCFFGGCKQAVTGFNLPFLHIFHYIALCTGGDSCPFVFVILSKSKQHASRKNYLFGSSIAYYRTYLWGKCLCICICLSLLPVMRIGDGSGLEIIGGSEDLCLCLCRCSCTCRCHCLCICLCICLSYSLLGMKMIGECSGLESIGGN